MSITYNTKNDNDHTENDDQIVEEFLREHNPDTSEDK